MIRKALAAAMVAVVAMLGLAPAATAQDYPAGTPAISCSPTSPTAGQPFTCTVTGFDDGTTVTFTWGAASGAAFGGFSFQDSGSTSATVSGGTASADITINTPGTYTVTAAGTSDGSPATASTTITVQGASVATGGDTLPATGAGNNGTLFAVAAGAVLLGGLFLVGARARRQTKGASL